MHWFFWVIFIVFIARTCYQIAFAAGAKPAETGPGTYAFAAIVSTLLAVGAWHFGHQFS